MNPRRAPALSCAVAAGLAALAVGASPARADSSSDPAYPGSTLSVSVSGPLQARQVLRITATGTNALDDPLGGPAISYGLELIVVDPQILSGPCEVSEQKELTDITDVPNAGQLLNFSDINEGPQGPFRITQPYEPGGYGPLLVCAYSKYIIDDAAHASTLVHIKPAAKGGGGAKHHAGPTARPRSLARPVVHRTQQTLRCSHGRWSNHPTQFTYRWKLGGGNLGSPRTSARLTLPAHTAAMTATCAVTASNAKGSARASSRPLRIYS